MSNSASARETSSTTPAASNDEPFIEATADGDISVRVPAGNSFAIHCPPTNYDYKDEIAKAKDASYQKGFTAGLAKAKQDDTHGRVSLAGVLFSNCENGCQAADESQGIPEVTLFARNIIPGADGLYSCKAEYSLSNQQKVTITSPASTGATKTCPQGKCGDGVIACCNILKCRVPLIADKNHIPSASFEATLALLEGDREVDFASPSLPKFTYITRGPTIGKQEDIDIGQEEEIVEDHVHTLFMIITDLDSSAANVNITFSKHDPLNIIKSIDKEDLVDSDGKLTTTVSITCTGNLGSSNVTAMAEDEHGGQDILEFSFTVHDHVPNFFDKRVITANEEEYAYLGFGKVRIVASNNGKMYRDRDGNSELSSGDTQRMINEIQQTGSGGGAVWGSFVKHNHMLQYQVTVKAPTRIQLQGAYYLRGSSPNTGKNFALVTGPEGYAELSFVKMLDPFVAEISPHITTQHRWFTHNSWSNPNGQYSWDLPTKGIYFLFATFRTIQSGCAGFGKMRLQWNPNGGSQTVNPGFCTGSPSNNGGSCVRMMTEFSSNPTALINMAVNMLWRVEVNGPGTMHTEGYSTAGSCIGLQSDGNGWQSIDFIKVPGGPDWSGAMVLNGNDNGRAYFNCDWSEAPLRGLKFELPKRGYYMLYAFLREGITGMKGTDPEGSGQIRIYDDKSKKSITNSVRLVSQYDHEASGYINHAVTFAWQVQVESQRTILIQARRTGNKCNSNGM
eukprot:UC4_evm3s1299